VLASSSCDECRRLKEKCEGGTPCKRCKHLRRSCDFDASPTLDKRVPVLADSLKVMKDRMQLMERLLRHHLPAINLETESLRQACDALSVPSPDLTIARDSPGVDRAELVSSISASDLGIEDEGCTIDNVNGAITRRSYPARPSATVVCRTLITVASLCRLLWRVLSLELFHARQTQCRQPDGSVQSAGALHDH